MESQACFAALEKVDVYEHSRTESWNTSIIVTTYEYLWSIQELQY